LRKQHDGLKRGKADSVGSANGKHAISQSIDELDKIKSGSTKTAKVIEVLKSWLKDESGYDEETWPQLKRALDGERRRIGARRLFDG
jgi:hypothetical protein